MLIAISQYNIAILQNRNIIYRDIKIEIIMFLQIKRQIAWSTYNTGFGGSSLGCKNCHDKVKQHWARIVLGWETAWEHRVLLGF